MKTFAITTVSVAVLASAAGAQILYDNGGPNFQNGNEMTNWVQAEDFVLNQNGIAGGVDFNLLDTLAGNNLGNWDGALQWQVYKDTGFNEPDENSLVAGGNGQNIGTTFLGNQNGFDFYDVRFNFGQNVNLNGGQKYWLAMHMSNDYVTRDELYWGTTNPNGTTSGTESLNGTLDNWFQNGQEHSFQLLSVPAPGAGALLGLSVLVAPRRRR